MGLGGGATESSGPDLNKVWLKSRGITLKTKFRAVSDSDPEPASVLFSEGLLTEDLT